MRNHFEHNIKNKTDLNDPILKIFIGAYQEDSNKGVISRSYKGLKTKKAHSTEYIKKRWEEEGNFSITSEDWLEKCKFQWKCTNSYTWREFGWKCLV